MKLNVERITSPPPPLNTQEACNNLGRKIGTLFLTNFVRLCIKTHLLKSEQVAPLKLIVSATNILCSSLTASGLNLSDEDTFSDTLEDVVTSVKRNGVAMKGTVHKINNYQ